MGRSRSALPDWMSGWVAKGLILAFGLGLFLLGLNVFHKKSLEWARERDRYLVAFSEIDCTPPPGQERADFLAEVRYLASLPSRFHLLEPDLAPRLSDAFGRHPWVLKVERVQITPPRQVEVRLIYRTAVLAVILSAEEGIRVGGLTPIPLRMGAVAPGRAFGRAVDAQGVLLPLQVKVRGVPVLEGKVAPPVGPAGTGWGDPTVEAAARTADFLRPYRQRLEVASLRVQDEQIILETPAATRILWGRAPGAELPGEARAQQKVERLLDYCNQHSDLGRPSEPYEHDVRPADHAEHHPLLRDSKSEQPARTAP